MKALLGGKGANLGEMTRIGLPVPCGFTISTEVCTYYYDHRRTYPKQLDGQIEAAVLKMEKSMGKNSAAWKTRCSSPSVPARVIPCPA